MSTTWGGGGGALVGGLAPFGGLRPGFASSLSRSSLGTHSSPKQRLRPCFHQRTHDDHRSQTRTVLLLPKPTIDSRVPPRPLLARAVVRGLLSRKIRPSETDFDGDHRFDMGAPCKVGSPPTKAAGHHCVAAIAPLGF